MAFVAEDGTGLSEANSLVTEEFATAYHADRGNAVWASYTVVQRRAFLVRATDYVERRYGTRFRSAPLTETQALTFPRVGFGMPAVLKRAVSEFALLESKNLLNPAPPNENGQWLKQRSTQVGPMTTRRVFSDKHDPSAALLRNVERLLDSLLTNAGVIRE